MPFFRGLFDFVAQVFSSAAVRRERAYHASAAWTGTGFPVGALKVGFVLNPQMSGQCKQAV